MEVTTNQHNQKKRDWARYYKALQQLAKNGPLTPDVVVAAARPKGSPLHDWFDWKDRSAAEKYRQEQAYRLIQGVRLVYNEGGETRAFYHVSPKEGYVETVELKKNPVMVEKVVEKAKMELEWWCDKYEDIDGLGHIAKQIRSLTKKLAKSA